MSVADKLRVDINVNSFDFALKDHVTIILSGESGFVIGRSDSLSGENQYLIRYQAADGRAVEQWWSENAIKRTAIA